MSGTNTLLVQGFGAGAGYGYGAICGGTYIGVSTESYVQSVIQAGVTFSHLGGNYKSQFGATPLLFRKNTASGNQTVTFATNADSYFYDSTHTDSVSAGDVIDIWQNNTAAVLSPRYSNIQCNNSTPLCMYGCGVASASGHTFSSTTQYSIVQGATSGAVTAANNSTKGSLQAAGTLSDLGMSVITAPTGTVTVNSNINGSSGNQALSFSSGTGYMQDTTHTDAIAAGTDVCTSFACTNSTGAWMTTQYQFAGTTSAFDVGLGNDAGMSPPATPYFGLGGYAYWGSTTETEISTGIQFAVTASLFRLRSTQGTSSTLTAFVRIAGANGNETLVLAAQSGLVTDSTHTDSITAGQLVDYSLVTNSNLASVFLTLNDGSNTGVPPYVPPPTHKPPKPPKPPGHGKGAKPKNYSVADTDAAASAYRMAAAPLHRRKTLPPRASETATGTLAFGPIAFSASGYKKPIGTAVLAFGPIGFNASGGFIETGTAVLAFGPVAFHGAGTRVETGAGGLAFGPVAFNAVGFDEPMGTATLAFGPIAIVAQGYDLGVPGGGLRQFWTF